MESWYDVVTPRAEVMAGRSFSPDEFAIALEQVVAGTGPDDYCRPDQFFARTCFTPGLTEQAGLVLRRLAGETQNTAPVLSLVSGFGGGKTHTLATLFHLVRAAGDAAALRGMRALLDATGLHQVPSAAVGVFVGNAWDPAPGRETPWIDLARQIAGDAGVAALGSASLTSPPGTDALGRVFQAAGRPVLILCDEVINFTARHGELAEGFLAFLHNLTVTLTGTSCGAAVVSLPQNAAEMTERDQVWHDRVTKVVRRVARDLIGGDETDNAEIVRRRLFEDLGPVEIRQRVAAEYADWCLASSERLPVEWSGVDSSLSHEELRDVLIERFTACYPFHPAALSVFERKWSGLTQFQQTRGMLVIFARWTAETFERCDGRSGPLITLGSAPLHDAEFCRTVIGQLGTSGLDVAFAADIVRRVNESNAITIPAHAETLDADTEGALHSIHRRVATAICFESAGGIDGRVARLPELRLALGEPDLETPTIDSAAFMLEGKAHFIHRTGLDGYRFSTRPKIDRLVNERRASLNYKQDVRPELRRLIEDAFQPSDVPVVFFPEDSSAVPDNPRLTLVVIDPDDPWTADDEQHARLGDWMRLRGTSPRMYPGGLLCCFRRPGAALRDRLEIALVWRLVMQELRDGVIREGFEPSSLEDAQSKLNGIETLLREEVAGAYQAVVLVENSQPSHLQVVDLGNRTIDSEQLQSVARHVLSALCDAAVVSESISGRFVQRVWPPVFRESGAWPLVSLRQSFFDGSLTRLVDAQASLRQCICAGVAAGEFGLAIGSTSDGSFARIWHSEPCPVEEIRFEPQRFLLTAECAAALKSCEDERPTHVSLPSSHPADTESSAGPEVIELTGRIPPGQWNRVGTRLLARLHSAGRVRVDASISVEVSGDATSELIEDLRQTLDELGLADSVEVRTR